MNSILEQLRALGDETRLRIINLLYEKELCVCDIMSVLELSQTKTSRHLAYLKRAGMVADRRYAQWTYYSLKKSENMKYLDSLVYENLRFLETYQTDLANLSKKQDNQKTCCL